MNISFRQLRLWLALAETGSVGTAAAINHVTQPTASMQLKQLTRAVGMPLYEVVSRKVYLTQAGEELTRTAPAIMAEWEALAQGMAGLKGHQRGRLRLAVVSTAKHFVPRWVGHFCAQHPDIEVSLEVLNRDGVLARLRDNQDDLYIMSIPPTDMALQDQVFMRNPLVVIAPWSHPLRKAKQVALSALKDQKFILRESGSGTRMAVDRHFKRQRFVPDLRMSLGSNEAIKEAVAGGLGLAVISQHALPAKPQSQGLVVLPVKGFPLNSQWHLVCPKAKRLSPLAQMFRTYLMQKSSTALS